MCKAVNLFESCSFCQHKLGKYCLGKVLGTGSFGQVVSAHLTNNDVGFQEVAIKIIGSLKHRMRALKEVEIGKRLNHPSIAAIYESFEIDDHVCIVMEKIDGDDLFCTLDQYQGGTPEHIMRPILRQIAEGIAHAHKMGIVHLDIKPENILIDKSTHQAKIIDWGLGAMVQPKQKLTSFVGSYEYCAPEILQSFPYDGKKADCWSFGVMMYVCLIGLFPWSGRNSSEVHNSILQAHHVPVPPTISKKAAHLISCLLKLSPSARIAMQTVLSHPWFSL
jgi:serine/threonine protein kinase